MDITLPHHHEDLYNISEISELLDRTDDFRITAELFRHLGDVTRLRLFWLLCHHEECVVNIAALLNMSSPAVSHHLKILKDSGLITFRRDGQEVYYRASGSVQSGLLHMVIEQVMEIACPDHKDDPANQGEPGIDHSCHACCGHHHLQDGTPESDRHLPKYREEQLITIRKIHDELSDNLEKRISLDDLSRKYLMNTTTMKSLFKELYGTSIAAHIRDHRMEKAADLLRNTSDKISSIAAGVGYESQSKFTAAFRDYYGVLPKDFRKNAGA